MPLRGRPLPGPTCAAGGGRGREVGQRPEVTPSSRVPLRPSPGSPSAAPGPAGGRGRAEVPSHREGPPGPAPTAAPSRSPRLARSLVIWATQ
ncbi:collagen alpha-2(I) chain-like [Psammomys obesus]|uniref:collagen alpha-2(I) chain-like n=1 Tax=Psammomys obesus TaxID=48139 RepID=UPI002452995B|nr:collagen alpha-2(I) chain-like [Psammomys obesus]